MKNLFKSLLQTTTLTLALCTLTTPQLYAPKTEKRGRDMVKDLLDAIEKSTIRNHRFTQRGSC